MVGKFDDRAIYHVTVFEGTAVSQTFTFHVTADVVTPSLTYNLVEPCFDQNVRVGGYVQFYAFDRTKFTVQVVNMTNDALVFDSTALPADAIIAACFVNPGQFVFVDNGPPGAGAYPQTVSARITVPMPPEVKDRVFVPGEPRPMQYDGASFTFTDDPRNMTVNPMQGVVLRTTVPDANISVGRIVGARAERRTESRSKRERSG
jgi:hypothetical protein